MVNKENCLSLLWNLDSIGRPDLCASHSIIWELLGGGSQSKGKLIQIKTTNQLCISSMGKGSTFPFLFWHDVGYGYAND